MKLIKSSSYAANYLKSYQHTRMLTNCQYPPIIVSINAIVILTTAKLIWELIAQRFWSVGCCGFFYKIGWSVIGIKDKHLISKTWNMYPNGYCAWLPFKTRDDVTAIRTNFDNFKFMMLWWRCCYWDSVIVLMHDWIETCLFMYLLCAICTYLVRFRSWSKNTTR